MLLLLYTIWFSISAPSEVILPIHKEFYFVSSCAYSAEPLYYRYNQEWHNQNKLDYTQSASGDRLRSTISGKCGFMLRELEEPLNNQSGKKMYRVLRNGIPLRGSEGSLARVIGLIRWLEQDMDRRYDHSPFTIGAVCEPATV